MVRRRALRIKASGIPAAYRHATLANFSPLEHSRRALQLTRRFVDEFLPGHPNPGILYTGTVGTGKTHLAASALRELIEQKGIVGFFVDVGDLLDRLRASYSDTPREREWEILNPLTTADLVVLDELGAKRSSEWAFETTERIIGALYNAQKTVLVTTNLPNRPVGASEASDSPYARAQRQETLGDRIGARMFSRLQQMCKTVEIDGADYRSRR